MKKVLGVTGVDFNSSELFIYTGTRVVCTCLKVLTCVPHCCVEVKAVQVPLLT